MSTDRESGRGNKRAVPKPFSIQNSSLLEEYKMQWKPPRE
jgi:hypothetical protein